MSNDCVFRFLRHMSDEEIMNAITIRKPIPEVSPMRVLATHEALIPGFVSGLKA